MKMLRRLFLYYSLLLSFLIFLSSQFHIKLFFLPVVIYLLIKSGGKIFKSISIVQIFTSRLFLYYNCILVSTLVVGGFLGVKSNTDLIIALFFSPLALYFGVQVLPRRKQALRFTQTIIPEPLPLPITSNKHPEKRHPEGVQALTPNALKGFDTDRRMFLKLVGSAGLGLFILSIFTKKAQAAFFGSVPGPGTVALKDTTGAQIDPAIKQPTDGYKISEVDDSSPAFYGFINKDGAWFIMKEGTAGDFRYTKGAISFTTNWTNRAALTYDYFHNVF